MVQPGAGIPLRGCLPPAGPRRLHTREGGTRCKGSRSLPTGSPGHSLHRPMEQTPLASHLSQTAHRKGSDSSESGKLLGADVSPKERRRAAVSSWCVQKHLWGRWSARPISPATRSRSPLSTLVHSMGKPVQQGWAGSEAAQGAPWNRKEAQPALQCA